MLLTAKAEELAEPVRSVLTQIRTEITRPGKFDPSTTRRRFSLVVSDYAYTTLVADVLAEADRIAPNLTFDITPPDAAASDRFERAEVDALLTVSPFKLDGHPSVELFSDEDVVISWTGAGYPMQLDEETFFETSHVATLLGPTRALSLSEMHLRKLPRERPVALVVPNFGALPQAVVGTKRIAVLHRLYAEHFARFYPISIHQPPIPMPRVVEIAQWHRVRDKDPGIRWLIDLMRAHASKLPAVAA